MKTRLIWKLFGLNLVIIGFVVAVVWGAVDYLAEGYFVTLMEKYHISPTESHGMFVESIHRYLLWGSLCGVAFSTVIGYISIRHILKPLIRMTQLSEKIAAGDFTAAAPVTTNDEVGQLARAFNRMTESLRHLEELRKNMIVDVAHELKTPLTNIQGYLEALMDDMVPKSRDTYLLLQEETARLGGLVSDILKLARSGGAKISLDVIDIRLPEVLNNARDAFHPKFVEKNITADLTGVPLDCQVRADPQKLTQVLHNLFENALQYAPSGGKLRVFAENLQSAVRITFANTNQDLRDEDLPFIFERFYRGEKSRSREFGGAGIGLSVIKDLVEAHNGDVGAFIQNGNVHVWLTLPAVPSVHV